MQIEALETVFSQLLGANPIVGNLLLLRNVLIRNLRIRFGLPVVASVGIVVVGETQHTNSPISIIIRSGFLLAVSERGMAHNCVTSSAQTKLHNMKRGVP
jgi:hypothetical protein